MSPQANQVVELARILSQGNIEGFLEETARFYDSSLTILSESLSVIAGMNLVNGGIEPAALPMRQEDGVWLIDSPRIHPVEVYGNTVGFVATEPAQSEDEKAAAALSRSAADLLSEMAVKEYELNDLSQEILDSYEEVNLFYDVSSALGTVRDVEGVCTVILRKACEIIKVRRASILLLDEKAGEMYIAAAMGLSAKEREGVRIPVGVGISGKVLESVTPQLVDDVGHLPTGLLKGYEEYATRSFISVPLCLERGGEPVTVEAVTVGDRACLSPQNGRAIGVMNMTDKVSEEDFTSGDLKLLTALAGQAAVLIQNIRLIELEKELRIARTIQQSLLPVAPPEFPGVELAGACVPARNVGGDYFDFLVRERDGHLVAAIADVSVHNMASALMMAVVRSALRGELRRCDEPGTVLDRLNGFLYEDLTRAELFLSLFCCIYDPETRILRYASAGHNPTLLYRPSDRSIRLLDTDGLLTGVLEDIVFPDDRTRLEVGDVILLYTDGIVEAGESAGALFGLDRLSAVLEEAHELPADVLLERIFDEVFAYTGEVTQADDMTAVVLKITDPSVR